MASLQNVWHHRRVAETQAKACWICYKPSSSVLITPDNKDFFYICPGHLKDKGFCSPDADETAALEEKKKKEELDKEIEAVKKEYETKQRIKQEKRMKKQKAKGGKDETEKKVEEEEDNKDEKEKEDKIKSLSQKTESQPEVGPRIYTLQKNFYQMRIKRIRDAEAAKRNRERLSNPSTFPSVPSGEP